MIAVDLCTIIFYVAYNLSTVNGRHITRTLKTIAFHFQQVRFIAPKIPNTVLSDFYGALLFLFNTIDALSVIMITLLTTTTTMMMMMI